MKQNRFKVFYVPNRWPRLPTWIAIDWDNHTDPIMAFTLPAVFGKIEARLMAETSDQN